MELFSRVKFGKFYVLFPGGLHVEQIGSFIIDANFISDTLDLTKEQSRSESEMELLKDVADVWQLIDTRRCISFTASAELSWKPSRTDMLSAFDLGHPDEKYFQKLERRFQRIAQATPEIRTSIFAENDSSVRSANTSRLSLPEKFDKGVFDELHNILYQYWATVLILMRYHTQIYRDTTFVDRLAMYHRFMKEMEERGIGRLPETLQLSRFIFFGGTVTKLDGKFKISAADLLKQQEWAKGVLGISKNVSWDLLYLYWMRSLNSGTFSDLNGQTKSLNPLNIALITGDRPLISFANMFQLERYPDGTFVIDYKYPDGTLVLENMSADEAEKELYIPYINRPVQSLKKANELRKVIPTLANLFSNRC